MRILSIEEKPIHRIAYKAPDGMRRQQSYELPVLVGFLDSLPDGLDALICASDLQGREAPGGKLLGELLAEELEKLCIRNDLPPASRSGILLCGDLYARTELDRRGGSGDVRSVWYAFRERFKWVAGVAGNHDHFGDSPKDLARLGQEPGIHFLDGRCAEIDGLRIAGISGIIGNPRRPFRRDSTEFMRVLYELLKQRPDVLLLHEGPIDAAKTASKGNSEERVKANMFAPHSYQLVLLAKKKITHLSIPANMKKNFIDCLSQVRTHKDLSPTKKKIDHLIRVYQERADQELLQKIRIISDNIFEKLATFEDFLDNEFSVGKIN